MKKMVTIVAIVLVALLVVSFAKDLIIKVAVEQGAELVTGLKLRMSGFSFGIMRGVVDIKNMRILNPKGYKDPTMINMPEIYVNYNLPAIISGKIYLPKVRIDMKEFTVVKNEKGELNLNSLKVVKAQKKEGKQPTGSEVKMPPLQIDSLRLRIGKAVYKDYSSGSTPSVKEFNINIDEEYTNIDNPYKLVSLIVVKALMNTTIAGLADFDLGSLKGSISDTLSHATKIAGKAQETVTKTTKTVTETTKTVKETAEAVSNVFKNPFGG
jgi:hypothetical protein